MKSAQDPVDLAEGQALLTHLQKLYCAFAENARLEATKDGKVNCSIELPSVGIRTCTASTPQRAIREAFLVVFDEWAQKPVREWPTSWPDLSERSGGSPVRAASKQTPTERFQSKGRQFTIGVTLPTRLKDAMQAIADQQSTSFADVARQLASFGFEEFDLRSLAEDGDELFSELASEIRPWLPSDTEQVMLRVEANLSVRLRVAAQEFRKSASEFGAMCIAAGLAKQAEFARIEERIGRVKGVKTRQLATQVGLGERSVLLAGILTGSIKAPKKVLAELGVALESSEGTLSHYFRRSFTALAVPAFKSDGKPQLSRRATPWKDAVKGLNLSPSEATALLALDA